RNTHGFRKIACNMRQRREKQISKIMSRKPASCVKAKLKQVAQQRFVARQRDHAVTNVSRRQDSVFAAQPARTSAIVGDSHNGGKIANRPFCRWCRILPPHDVMLKPTQQRGKSRATPEGNNAKTAMARIFVRMNRHTVSCGLKSYLDFSKTKRR